VRVTGGTDDLKDAAFGFFVAAVGDEAAAESVAESTDGRVIGRVEDGDGVSIRGLEL